MKACRWLRGVLWRLLQIPGVPLLLVLGVALSVVLEVLVVLLELVCWLGTGEGRPPWLHSLARRSYFYSDDRCDWRDRCRGADHIEPPQPPPSRRGPPA